MEGKRAEYALSPGFAGKRAGNGRKVKRAGREIRPQVIVSFIHNTVWMSDTQKHRYICEQSKINLCSGLYILVR